MTDIQWLASTEPCFFSTERITVDKAKKIARYKRALRKARGTERSGQT